MEGSARYGWLLDAASELPGVRLEDRTAWEMWVLWAGEKWFGLLVPGRELLNLKGDPDLNAALVGAHDWITPGWHMNKRHWISLALDSPALDRALALELVEHAWEVCLAGQPARVREPLLLARSDAQR